MNEETKRPLDENNFYVRDYPGANQLFLINTGLAWRAGQAHYGIMDGTVQGWGLEPPDCLQMATPEQAAKWSEKFAIKDAKKRIIYHLDEIKRLGDIIKEYSKNINP